MIVAPRIGSERGTSAVIGIVIELPAVTEPEPHSNDATAISYDE